MISFKHFVIIDFEATCNEPVNPDPQEIIEFPAIALDVMQRKVIAEFHQYVKPIFHPELTDFCKDLTGIAQSTVDNSNSFPKVLQKFNQWLLDNNLDNFIILTCGDWDFGNIFPVNCKIHNLSAPAWSLSTGNVKHLFCDTFTGVKKMGLSGMLSYLGMQFEGHPHSGIDDTRNIARIVLDLLTRNGNFNSLNTPAAVPLVDAAMSPEDQVMSLINQLTPQSGKAVAEEIEWKIFDIAKTKPEVVFTLADSDRSNVREVAVFVLRKLTERDSVNSKRYMDKLRQLSYDSDFYVSKKANIALDKMRF